MPGRDDSTNYRSKRKAPAQGGSHWGGAGIGQPFLRFAGGIEGLANQVRAYLRNIHNSTPSEEEVEHFIENLAYSPSDREELERWIGEDVVFSWLDEIRANSAVSIFEFAVAVAALMCLRWIEADEAEARAILEFEGGELPSGPALADFLERWLWSQQRPSAKRRVIEKLMSEFAAEQSTLPTAKQLLLWLGGTIPDTSDTPIEFPIGSRGEDLKQITWPEFHELVKSGKKKGR